MELQDVNVDRWEIARERIVLREPIGHGAFGAVSRALLHRSHGRAGNRSVAAKCLTRKFVDSTKHLILVIITIEAMRFLLAGIDNSFSIQDKL